MQNLIKKKNNFIITVQLLNLQMIYQESYDFQKLIIYVFMDIDECCSDEQEEVKLSEHS